MVQDLVHNLCESLVENIDGVAGNGKKTPPTPITYYLLTDSENNLLVDSENYQLTVQS
jgi:hypothetical protein